MHLKLHQFYCLWITTFRLNVETLNESICHGIMTIIIIMMVSFPSHCSHRVQREKLCEQWMPSLNKNHVGRTLEIHHFPPIVYESLDVAATNRTYTSGFRDTEIFHFIDLNVFRCEDFLTSDLSGKNQCAEHGHDDPYLTKCNGLFWWYRDSRTWRGDNIWISEGQHLFMPSTSSSSIFSA